MRVASDKLLHYADLSGTFIFGMEAAMRGINGHLDLFGILVLSLVTSTGGGIIRDLVIGSVPPASIKDPSYATSALVGGVCAMIFYSIVKVAQPNVIMVLDAAGLSLFAMAGAAKALDFKMHPFMCVVLATLTGCGGGTIRDLLLQTIPGVLLANIYAVAALSGATVMVACVKAGISRQHAMVIGFFVCFLLRVLSVWQGWNLPILADYVNAR